MSAVRPHKGMCNSTSVAWPTPRCWLACITRHRCTLSCAWNDGQTSTARHTAPAHLGTFTQHGWGHDTFTRSGLTPPRGRHSHRVCGVTPRARQRQSRGQEGPGKDKGKKKAHALSSLCIATAHQIHRPFPPQTPDQQRQQTEEDTIQDQ